METASMLPNYAFIWIGNQLDVNEHPNNVFLWAIFLKQVDIVKK